MFWMLVDQWDPYFHLADLEVNVYARSLRYLHNDLLCLKDFKPWSCDREIVSARGQARLEGGWRARFAKGVLHCTFHVSSAGSDVSPSEH